MSNLSIIQGDLNELKFLKTQCKRDGVKMILSNQIRLLEEKQRNMSIPENNRKGFDNNNNNIVVNNNNNNININNLENTNKKIIQEIPIEAYTPITKYSWDQTDKNIKIYIDVVGIQDKTECLDIKFSKDNIDMQIKNLNNKFYSFTVKLHDEVKADECTYKFKKDMIIITLKKLNANSKWPRLSYKDSLLKKSNANETMGGFGDLGNPEMKDPMAGIQDLMKKMYEEGDDEMKRTIAKAWTEAQSKNMKMP